MEAVRIEDTAGREFWCVGFGFVQRSPFARFLKPLTC